MKFDIVVGNPPYGVAQKGSSPNLHLKIMNSIIKFCTNKLVFIMPSKPIVVQLQEPWFSIFKNAVCNKIEVVGKDVFKGTDMDNTAIYYCDRNDDPKNYCKKLDVDKVIYNMIDSDAHRLFLKMFDEIEQMYITIPYGSKENKTVLEPTSVSTSFINSVKFNEKVNASLKESVSEDGKTITYTSTGDGYDNATYTLIVKIETVQHDAANSFWK